MVQSAYTTACSRRMNFLACISALLLLAGNAELSASDRTKAIAIGSIAGALIGHEIDDDRGALLGATIGAITGVAAARYLDAQRRELETVPARDRAREIEVELLQDEILAVRLRNKATFAVGSDKIAPAFHDALDRLARSLVRYGHTFIHIVGHTDDTGSVAYNNALSFRRAEVVARFLIERGVDPRRLRIVGLGESEPLRPNDTELHRQWNRRVEIYIRPIIEGEERSAPRLPDRLSTARRPLSLSR